MDIRGQRTWCDACTAPLVLHENVPVIEFFLEALPAYVGGQGLFGSSAMEGFDRAGVWALMDLRAVDPEARADLWSAIVELESEYRNIRAERTAATDTKRKA